MAAAVPKCKSCEKKVYVVDQLSADGCLYHKSCFRCTHCNSTLKLTNYSSVEGVLYCKPHYTQLLKQTGSFERSFVGTRRSARKEQSTNSTKSQSNGRFSTKFLGTQDRCVICCKTVYPLEKVSTDGNAYHKLCFRCSHGGCVISTSTYTTHEGKLYCKHHHLQLFMAKGDFSQLEERDLTDKLSQPDTLSSSSVNNTALAPKTAAAPTAADAADKPLSADLPTSHEISSPSAAGYAAVVPKKTSATNNPSVAAEKTDAAAVPKQEPAEKMDATPVLKQSSAATVSTRKQSGIASEKIHAAVVPKQASAEGNFLVTVPELSSPVLSNVAAKKLAWASLAMEKSPSAATSAAVKKPSGKLTSPDKSATPNVPGAEPPSSSTNENTRKGPLAHVSAEKLPLASRAEKSSLSESVLPDNNQLAGETPKKPGSFTNVIVGKPSLSNASLEKPSLVSAVAKAKLSPHSSIPAKAVVGKFDAKKPAVAGNVMIETLEKASAYAPVDKSSSAKLAAGVKGSAVDVALEKTMDPTVAAKVLTVDTNPPVVVDAAASKPILKKGKSEKTSPAKEEVSSADPLVGDASVFLTAAKPSHAKEKITSAVMAADEAFVGPAIPKPSSHRDEVPTTSADIEIASLCLAETSAADHLISENVVVKQPVLQVNEPLTNEPLTSGSKPVIAGTGIEKPLPTLEQSPTSADMDTRKSIIDAGKPALGGETLSVIGEQTPDDMALEKMPLATEQPASFVEVAIKKSLSRVEQPMSSPETGAAQSVIETGQPSLDSGTLSVKDEQTSDDMASEKPPEQPTPLDDVALEKVMLTVGKTSDDLACEKTPSLIEEEPASTSADVPEEKAPFTSSAYVAVVKSASKDIPEEKPKLTMLPVAAVEQLESANAVEVKPLYTMSVDVTVDEPAEIDLAVEKPLSAIYEQPADLAKNPVSPADAAFLPPMWEQPASANVADEHPASNISVPAEEQALHVGSPSTTEQPALHDVAEEESSSDDLAKPRPVTDVHTLTDMADEKAVSADAATEDQPLFVADEKQALLAAVTKEQQLSDVVDEKTASSDVAPEEQLLFVADEKPPSAEDQPLSDVVKEMQASADVATEEQPLFVADEKPVSAEVASEEQPLYDVVEEKPASAHVAKPEQPLPDVSYEKLASAGAATIEQTFSNVADEKPASAHVASKEPVSATDEPSSADAPKSRDMDDEESLSSSLANGSLPTNVAMEGSG